MSCVRAPAPNITPREYQLRQVRLLREVARNLRQQGLLEHASEAYRSAARIIRLLRQETT